MKKIKPLPSFERLVKKLTLQEKKQLAQSLEALNTFLLTGIAPFGFRYKKIGDNKYEFRVDVKLRVVVKEVDDIIYLVLVGNHDDVARYLRDYK